MCHTCDGTQHCRRYHRIRSPPSTIDHPSIRPSVPPSRLLDRSVNTLTPRRFSLFHSSTRRSLLPLCEQVEKFILFESPITMHVRVGSSHTFAQLPAPHIESNCFSYELRPRKRTTMLSTSFTECMIVSWMCIHNPSPSLRHCLSFFLPMRPSIHLTSGTVISARNYRQRSFSACVFVDDESSLEETHETNER